MDSEDWKHLVAVLFYLAFATSDPGSRFNLLARPHAENFYFEHFEAPSSEKVNSNAHVRVSKYFSDLHSDLQIYPGPEVRLATQQLIYLPSNDESTLNKRLIDLSAGLFERLDQELKETESHILRSLVFFMMANYLSAARSTFAEDLQNICSAFESLLNISERPREGTASVVTEKLQLLFEDISPRPLEILSGDNRTRNEEHGVLARLKEWIQALYDIRNSYSHGKIIADMFFKERSIWRDDLKSTFWPLTVSCSAVPKGLI